MQASLKLGALALASAVSVAAWAAAEVAVSVRNPLPLSSDGEHLVFAFDLAARNDGPAPLAVRAVDYSVSIQGTRFFSGTAQGFTVDAGSEKAVPIAGFTAGEGEAIILGALRGSQRYRFQVTGVLHLRGESGPAVDRPFDSSGEGTTPEEIAQAPERKPATSKYSLLSY
jgi:hypothetical protein